MMIEFSNGVLNNKGNHVR